MERLIERTFQVVSKIPYLFFFLTDPEIGRPHGIGFVGKLRLIVTFYRNIQRVQTLSSVVEHLELAAALLRIPPQVEGVVVECGCFQGGSSVNLSVICDIVGRRLVICDSFEGLPKPAEYDESHPVPHRNDTEDYEEGQFAASLELVKDNLRRYGKLEVCDFVVGFFDKSLADWDRPLVLAFLDVDLIDSLRPCLTAFWPYLDPAGRLYVHEAGDLDLVATFFEADWWQRELGIRAPGFIGAGTGLPLMPVVGSELGYALKAAAGS